jgi:hypothetical protein
MSSLVHIDSVNIADLLSGAILASKILSSSLTKDKSHMVLNNSFMKYIVLPIAGSILREWNHTLNNDEAELH